MGRHRFDFYRNIFFIIITISSLGLTLLWCFSALSPDVEKQLNNKYERSLELVEQRRFIQARDELENLSSELPMASSLYFKVLKLK